MLNWPALDDASTAAACIRHADRSEMKPSPNISRFTTEHAVRAMEDVNGGSYDDFLAAG